VSGSWNELRYFNLLRIPANNWEYARLERISDAHLDLLIPILQDAERGVDRMLSENESAAVDAYTAAVELRTELWEARCEVSGGCPLGLKRASLYIRVVADRGQADLKDRL
jgi:hypothetical protein